MSDSRNVERWVDEKYGKWDKPHGNIPQEEHVIPERELCGYRDALIEAVEIVQAAKETAEEYKDQDPSVQVEGLWMTHSILATWLEGLDEQP